MLGAGAALLSAGAPSTDPRSGDIGFAISQGLSGMTGADKQYRENVLMDRALSSQERQQEFDNMLKMAGVGLRKAPKTINLMLGPEGTPSDDLHTWGFDPGSGEFDQYVGPTKGAAGLTVNVGQGKPAPTGERQEITGLLDMKSKAARIDSLYGESVEKGEAWVGPIKGRLAEIGEKYTGEIGPGEVEFRQLIRGLVDDLGRMKSGGQINAAELALFKSLIPSENSPPNVFRYSMDSFMKTLDEMLKIKEGALKESGFKPVRGEGGQEVYIYDPARGLVPKGAQ
jgi:hypothetical protein